MNDKTRNFLRRYVVPAVALLLVLLAVYFYGDKLLTLFGELPEITEAPESTVKVESESTTDVGEKLDRNGSYTTKEDVALYIYTYKKLPDNFITKTEARKLGWDGGGLEDIAPGKCIGGDEFGNREGLLPKKQGRKYYECDIDTLGTDARGAKRIVFSNDGLIYYTGDHYESFTLLYGVED